MKTAYITSSQQGQSDALLSQVAAVLLDRGLTLSGIVQINTDRPDSHRCDMDVAVLPDGPTIRISQTLGAHARGCRLDPSALETAVVAVASGLNEETDLLVLNKFGKHEACGRGFRDLIAEALTLGVPVLTAVNALNEAAFLAFTDGMAEALPSDVCAVCDWAAAACATAKTAA